MDEYIGNTHNIYLKGIGDASHDDVHRALIERLQLKGRNNVYVDEECMDWRINVIMSKGEYLGIAHIFIKNSEFFSVLTGMIPLVTEEEKAALEKAINDRKQSNHDAKRISEGPLFNCSKGSSIGSSVGSSITNSLGGSFGKLSGSSGSWADADMDELPDADFLADFNKPITLAPILSPVTSSSDPMVQTEVVVTTEVVAEQVTTEEVELPQPLVREVSCMLTINVTANSETITVPVCPAGVVRHVDEEESTNVITCARLPPGWDEQRLKKYFSIFVEYPENLYFRGHNSVGLPMYDTQPFVVIRRRKVWSAFIYFDISNREAQFAILACKRNIPGVYLELAKKSDVPSLNMPRECREHYESRSPKQREQRSQLRESTNSLDVQSNIESNTQSGSELNSSNRAYEKTNYIPSDKPFSRLAKHTGKYSKYDKYDSGTKRSKLGSSAPVTNATGVTTVRGKRVEKRGMKETKVKVEEQLPTYVGTNMFDMLGSLDLSDSTDSDKSDDLTDSVDSDNLVDSGNLADSTDQVDQQTMAQSNGESITFEIVESKIEGNDFLVGPVLSAPDTIAVAVTKVSYANPNRSSNGKSGNKSSGKGGKRKGGKKGRK